MRNKLFGILVLMLLVGAVSANVTAERTYFSEETAVPFEIWALMLGAGLVFLVIGAIVGFGYGNAGLTMVFGMVSTIFLSGAAFAAPVTGFYSYVTNATTNATSLATPTIWLIFQPWMMWLLWGLASVGFIVFVLGLLILFKERADKEDQQWI